MSFGIDFSRPSIFHMSVGIALIVSSFLILLVATNWLTDVSFRSQEQVLGWSQILLNAENNEEISAISKMIESNSVYLSKAVGEYSQIIDFSKFILIIGFIYFTLGYLAYMKPHIVIFCRTYFT